ncbi:HD-GYP domain-containing protein [Heliobacterium chlorum]|uniref:HD-GYP domain-containing protein n=1 Tax=Heliobacterium chlorum TaxID=2698 RepID=A0ABR7SYH3_HELCL|nr:HD-GYP domain-containing protein [Heliobacterium chlorum]MBC9783588.1 HD-GYP domain-containing protein [Heliobacterium chlorum]
MIRISTRLVEPGAVLARPVYDGRGNILLAPGVTLTSNYLRRLESLEIGSIYIEGPFSDLVNYENALSDRIYVEVMKNTKKLVDVLGSTRTHSDLSVAKKSVELIVDELLRNRGTLIDVNALHDYDEYTFTHSVSVCVLSIIIGLQKGLSRQELYILGMGALLHDIGKTKVPLEILNKPGKLTEEECTIMMQHPSLGFDLLRKNSNLLSAHVAFQHQEKFNGTGYPRNLKGEDIHLFARITSVADVYDALTSKRPYRSPITGNKAYEYLLLQSTKQFDPEIIKLFTETVAIFPNGTMVQLSNRKKALVVKQNSGNPLRPIVCLIENTQILDTIDLTEEQHSGLQIDG